MRFEETDSIAFDESPFWAELPVIVLHQHCLNCQTIRHIQQNSDFGDSHMPWDIKALANLSSHWTHRERVTVKRLLIYHFHHNKLSVKFLKGFVFFLFQSPPNWKTVCALLWDTGRSNSLTEVFETVAKLIRNELLEKKRGYLSKEVLSQQWWIRNNIDSECIPLYWNDVTKDGDDGFEASKESHLRT